MKFSELVELRQSCRVYDPEREVEPEKLQRILESARLAPSACNSQPWHLITVTDSSLRSAVADALASMGMNKWAAQAPAFIVIVQESPNFTARLGGWVKNKHFPLIDCGIVASHITLAATSEGLGSCILGWFGEKQLRKLLGIPRSKRVLMVISLGYSLDKQREHTRYPLEKISSSNKY
ncbi:MAG: nitroreductase family protein [Muribaculaceae bacterium]|nr:nitroreductase family protein [Muribaculaceae bacterium]